MLSTPFDLDNVVAVVVVLCYASFGTDHIFPRFTAAFHPFRRLLVFSCCRNFYQAFCAQVLCVFCDLKRKYYIVWNKKIGKLLLFSGQLSISVCVLCFSKFIALFLSFCALIHTKYTHSEYYIKSFRFTERCKPSIHT